MGESLDAHASRRSRRSLLSMRLLCFGKLDLILRRPPTGRANARPMTGSAPSRRMGCYPFVIPGTRVYPPRLAPVAVNVDPLGSCMAGASAFPERLLGLAAVAPCALISGAP